MTLDELWWATDPALWHEAVDSYWKRIGPDRLDVERRMERVTLEEVAGLTSEEWWNFLQDYYFWKYTQGNILASSLGRLRRQRESKGLEYLDTLRERLLALDPEDSARGIHIATRHAGLGVAGATGLLSVIHPRWFGTLDQFVVRALRRVENRVPEWQELDAMNLDGLGGVLLTHRLRARAAELSRTSGEPWTPRRVDMALWAVRD